MTDKPMRVLHIMPQIGIGGAEKQLCALVANSDPEIIRHEVLYYSDSNDDEGYKLYDKNNIIYHRIARNKKRLIEFLRTFSKEIKKRNPDIVHCWLWSANIWGRWAALLAGVKNIIVTYRGGHFSRTKVLRLLEKLTTRRVHYLANSRACANMTAEKLGVVPNKFDVIHNGIEFEKFTMSLDRHEFAQQLGVPSNNKIITMVGRLIDSKNYPMLLRIAQKFREKSLPVHFMIAGHGEKEVELKEMANRMEVGGVVHFLGLRNDIPKILQSSDAFCYTTLYEGFPNALLEAMAAGLPIVTTDFNGVTELITDGVNGKIVPVNDVDAAFSALQLYLDDKELAETFGKAARQRVLSTFSIETMVEKTLTYYQKLLER